MKNTIRLKAHVVDVHGLQGRELIIATMTSSAELLRLFITAKTTRIEDRFVTRFASLNCSYVRRAWSMTTLTANTMRQFVELQLLSARRAV